MPFLARRYPEIFHIIVSLFILLYGAQYNSIFWYGLQFIVVFYVCALAYSLWRESIMVKKEDFRDTTIDMDQASVRPEDDEWMKAFEKEEVQQQ